jgi:hypothetical protein
MRTVEAMIEPSGAGWRSELVEHVVPGEKVELTADAEVAGSTRVFVIFVIGGVTHAEISLMRWLALQGDPEHPRHVVICTTNVTSGGKILDSILPFNAGVQLY